MNVTIKLTLSLLSVASLTSVVACTVTTNTDGNDNPTVFVPDEDAGDTALVCPPSGQLSTIGGAEYPSCQTCLNTNCCAELHQCYDIAGGDAGTDTDCETYSQCIDGCNSFTDPSTQSECFKACDSSAAPGVLDGYNAINSCAAAHCAAPTCLIGSSH